MQEPRPEPQPYAPTPQPFAPTPQPYAPQPQSYAPQPQSYAPQAQSYAPQAQPYPSQAQSYAPQPQPYPTPPYPQGQPVPYGPPHAFPAPGAAGAPWPPGPGLVQPPATGKPWRSPLPVEPMRYHGFLHTPRRRWWKFPIALIVAAAAWFFASIIAALPAMAFDAVAQHVNFSNVDSVLNYLKSFGTKLTPALFLANNIGIALMIPCAWLGLIIYGQKPRWLSSVTGGIRWGWLFRLLGLIAIPYLVLQALDIFLLGGLPALSWKPYSVFMIAAVLLTTPLQCAGEEYGMRGLVNRVFGSYGSRRVSFWIGAVASSLLFMSLHVAADPYLNTFYFTFGMVACWMAWRTGGLEASIAMHVVNNVFSMVYLPFTDFSGMMDRSVGSASAMDVAPILGVMLASVGIVEWQVRRRSPVAIAAPGATDAPPAALRFTPLEAAH